ncbi:biotin--[acetyl-CoA-carboxylase] ligase [Flavobacterium sp. H122]|uniref:biotin--[acetyl-CoA-carboxylase] ligase n=1 Tax=Flavobacterium sp. H122 TaxID=2529860 RepID=UPI0010A9C224|nr:biotin--[acetyl-CoA-carboxylase] ligase [Flavobacterium sp. H122]
MNFIKLNAIDSTNDFLKALASSQKVENFTVVTAKSQWKGKGQMGSEWQTEDNKNLITSILIKKTISNTESIFVLNIAIAISIIEALKTFKIPDLSIKWPNDIMSGNKKIAGILIENNIKESGKIQSIVGIGLNVNQLNFENLPKASSLKAITGVEYDTEEILFKIIDAIKLNVASIKSENAGILWKKYHDFLFKIGKPVVFENSKNEKFMGIIQKVNTNGLLDVMLEDDSIHSYGIKEISMIY